MSILWPYQSLGDPSRPTLVFLHGFLGRGADWLAVGERLSADYHCILPDLPGHGANTDLHPADPLTFDLLSDGLAETLATAGVDRPALIGYSLGGRVALHFALKYPDRPRAIVLESASPGLRSEAERTARCRLDDARAARLREIGMIAFLEEWYRADLWVSLRERPDLLAALVQDRSETHPAPAAAALADLSPGRMEPLWDRLPGLAVPVLLLSGDLDPKYTQIAAEAAERIPAAAHIRIPEAGHNIHLEQPGRFVDSIRGFVQAKINLEH